MELEQLIGVIRHMRAQKQALDYLDEALTQALESKDLVAKSEKLVKEHEAHIQQLKDEADALEEDHQTRLAQAKKIQEETAKDIKNQLEREMAIIHQETLQAQARLDSALHAESLAQTRIVDLQNTISKLEQDRDKMEGEVVKVRQIMRDLQSTLTTA